MLSLVTSFQEWVHRRVESIEILDDRSAHRRVSIDFELPPVVAGHVADRKVLPLMPLSFLDKNVLRNFDLRDEKGRAVSMLNRVENGQLAGDTLVLAAEGVTGEQMPPSVEGRLRFITESSSTDARRELERWTSFTRQPLRRHRRLWTRLLADPGFVDYATTLAENFILFAAIGPERKRRCMAKLSYEELFQREAHGADVASWKRPLLWLGWMREAFRLAAPAANLAASFHLELAAPTETNIDVARLRFLNAEGQAVRRGLERVDGPLVRRAHLYASEVPENLVGEAVVYFRARRAGLLRAGTLLGLLTAALLFLGFAFIDDVTAPEASQPAAALFLLAPTFFSAWLIRPGEHRLVASFMAGMRLFISMQLVAAITCVALLAGVAEGIRKWIWLGAAVLAALAALGLIVSYRYPRPTSS